MTENEAIKILRGAIKKPNTKDGYLGQAVTMSIQALEEIQQYRAKSAEWNKYLMARTELEELSGHTVDVVKLLHYFSETIFQGEKHDGFCILTNEDAKMWEDFNAIGTVEEFKALKENVRLIDANALLQEFETENTKSDSNLWHIIGIKAFIDNQPTAYDAEKAVEQLTENLNRAETELANLKGVDQQILLAEREHLTGKKLAYATAIDIIRKGGIE